MTEKSASLISVMAAGLTITKSTVSWFGAVAGVLLSSVLKQALFRAESLQLRVWSVRVYALTCMVPGLEFTA